MILHLAPDDKVVVACRELKPEELLKIRGALYFHPASENFDWSQGGITHNQKGRKDRKIWDALGSARQDIVIGNHVHTHNMQSD